MNSLGRLLRILDQFDVEPGILTAEQLHETLGYSRSTLYRYLKVLSDAGLITSFHGIGYSLGPRIVELNAMIMSRDPLIVTSAPLMEMLALRFHGTSLLFRRFRDRVLCVHQVADEGVYGPSSQVGRTRALTRGAAARVILAQFSAAHLRRFYKDNAEDCTSSGLGEDLLNVRRKLKSIRERGFDCEPCMSGVGAVSIAAPIIDGAASVVGSLALALPQAVLPEDRICAIAELVMRHAEQIGHSISR